MGIFSRLSDIVNSNVHAMLDQAEDPEKLVRLIIQEMEDTLVEIRSTSVRTIARKKELQRSLSRSREAAADWESKAEMALSKDREDLARAALAAKARVEDHALEIEKELKLIDEEIDKLDKDTAKLKAKLAEAKARQKSIIMRQASAKSRLKARERVHSSKMDDAMLRFEQYEGRIDGLEAQLESFDLGEHRSLDQEFADLEAERRVEDELARLKARLGRSGDAPAGDAS